MGSPQGGETSRFTATIDVQGTLYGFVLPCTVPSSGTYTGTTFTTIPASSLISSYILYAKHDQTALCDCSALSPSTTPASMASTADEQSSTPYSTTSSISTAASSSGTVLCTTQSSPLSTSTASADSKTSTVSSSNPAMTSSQGSATGSAIGTSRSEPLSTNSGSRSSNGSSQHVTRTATGITSSMSAAEESHPRRANAASIAGGVVGGLLCLLLFLGALWFRGRQRRCKVAPSAEFMGKGGICTPPEAFAPRHTFLHDTSLEPGDPPPPFTPGLYTDQIFEKMQETGDRKAPLEDDEDGEGSVDGSVPDTPESTLVHSDHIGEAM
ncbi:hypothetical protein DAEQUDRAFT_727217 [Daedalea quercina L-15889]|uniref:Uncharacterized protein n=1 Tax=Daedalea quercina L-15889 TaxID=1314783 RepID=A0A165Q5K1_9APHY|nr:hypothetical protein DAEQUDRAFT_727217 [Daedalea quercina L-15889]